MPLKTESYASKRTTLRARRTPDGVLSVSITRGNGEILAYDLDAALIERLSDHLKNGSLAMWIAEPSRKVSTQGAPT